MSSGLDTLNSIDSALHSVRSEAVRLDTQLAQMTQQTAIAEHKRMNIIHEITRVRLQEIDSGELSEELTAADRDAKRILKDREAAFERLNSTIAEQHELIAQQEEERSKSLARVNSIAQKISESQLAVQTKLTQDKTYKALLDEATWADTVAEESKIKVERAQSNMAEKAIPFKSDPLFMYLWERGYGTTDYQGGLIARWLDAKVAKLISYEPARVNYWNLTEIPLRLERHAEQVAEQAQDKLAAVQQYEIDARKSAGIPQLEEQAETAREELDLADDKMEDCESDLNEMLAERAQFVGGDDKYTQQCLSRLASALDHKDIDAVYRYALVTASPTDDQLILELSELEQRNQSVKADLQDLRVLHERQIQRLKDIEGVRRQFKNSRYDDARSRFNNTSLIATTLTQFVQGMVSGSEVWNTLQRNQHYINAGVGREFGSEAIGGTFGGGAMRQRTQANRSVGNSTWNWPKPRTPRVGGGTRTRTSGGKFKTGGSF